MDQTQDNGSGNGVGRRDFFKAATAGVTTAAVLLSPRDAALAQEAAQKAALERIASNSWPIRPLFKQRAMGPRPAGATAPGGTAGAGSAVRRGAGGAAAVGGRRCRGGGGQGRAADAVRVPASRPKSRPTRMRHTHSRSRVRPRLPGPTCPMPPR